jgi:hypothetical protein
MSDKAHNISGNPDSHADIDPEASDIDGSGRSVPSLRRARRQLSGIPAKLGPSLGRAGIQKGWNLPWLVAATLPMLGVLVAAVVLLTLIRHLDSDDDFSRALLVAVTGAAIGAVFAIVGWLRDRLFTSLLKRQQTAARLWAMVTSNDGGRTGWDDEAVTEMALFVIDAARRRADDVGDELMRLRSSGDLDRDGECARVLKALMSPEMRKYFELRDG